MQIKAIKGEFSVCKVRDLSKVDLESEFCFIGKTDEETSLVCLTECVPDNCTHREDGWKAMRIQGELDFSLVGILSRIAGLMAENSIGIFAVSTYNTDYILVKRENFQRALNVLSDKGYDVIA